MARRALITGITGQDGSYLSELLLDRGYEVRGLVRRAPTERFERIEHLRGRITLHQGELIDDARWPSRCAPCGRTRSTTSPPCRTSPSCGCSPR